ncbi:hypothetical protein EV360DRAFT_89419 [Lentinula raphanica]|nr:hypothetical protein EV360DRAFT_89419 [Lentinula raphanica]
MNRLALRVVYVVGAVSTTLAAPTLQPPSEALSGLEEPSTAPLYQFQTDSFPATATGLDVREPQVTTILSDETVRTGPDDLFDEAWSIRDNADAHDVRFSFLAHTTPAGLIEEICSLFFIQHAQDAVTLADISYNHVDSKPSAAGLDVREPKAMTIVVDSVRTSPDDLFDKTWSLRDDTDAHDHDQSAVTDASYNHLNSKLSRRAGASDQKLVDVSYEKYVQSKKDADESYAQFGRIQPGSEETNLIAKVDAYDDSALSWLEAAHKHGTHARVKGKSGYKLIPLPDLEEERERVENRYRADDSKASTAPTGGPAGTRAGTRAGGSKQKQVTSDDGDDGDDSDDVAKDPTYDPSADLGAPGRGRKTRLSKGKQPAVTSDPVQTGSRRRGRTGTNIQPTAETAADSDSESVPYDPKDSDYVPSD